ncbi:AarF/ABC1/UbiB kinase family protein [Nocardia yunnanensis]|uniref:AarF/ABC1/UbiB kinase family protein n=1 Tax=Nocardia yunnanensis TaxID=2382165 RepID=A0A386ZPI0_9NOCA|nr:AarF/ABC1/UbiB kinase family protein [Nocardia yunnanensis]AYF78475.1 AarF/ABC1/UbiB kinase family protein [Nocardia yunnanensis]
MPTNRLARDAKLAGVPVAYAGRRMAGRGRRLLGRSAAEIDRDIRLRTAEHLFEVLGELKGCAAKLGQLGAVYRSILPFEAVGPDWTELAEVAGDALSRLQDSVPPMLPGLVHQVMAANFGDHWRELFLEFEECPAAAASLGQVHRAVWHDGRPVAVKVMYPGAREAVQADLRTLRGLSGVIGAVMPGADVRAIVDMVCTMVGDELDYRREARYQRTCAEVFAGDPEFVVPEVVECADEVLISDWLEGTGFGTLVTHGSARERSRAGLAILEFMESAKLRCGVLYTDVHPGNFLLLDDGRVGVVDFGACAPMPPSLRRIVSELGDALYNGTPGDFEAALRAHGFVRPGQEFDIDELVRIVSPFLDVLLQKDFRLTTDWMREQVTVITRIRLSNVFRDMTLPPELTTLARAAVTALGVLCQLGTEGIRDQFLDGWPELAEVVDRYEARRDLADTAT